MKVSTANYEAFAAQRQADAEYRAAKRKEQAEAVFSAFMPPVWHGCLEHNANHCGECRTCSHWEGS